MKDSARLQREAEVQRAGLSNTLGQLRDGMTSEALAAEILGIVRHSSLGVVKSLSEAARNNPGAALMIGTGLMMMLTRTTGSDVVSTASSALKSTSALGADTAASAAASMRGTAGEVADKAKSFARDAVGQAGRMATSAVDGTASLKQTAEATVGSVREKVHDRGAQADGVVAGAKAEAAVLASDARQAMTRILEEQPILVAAIGTALGALLGAALPVSEAERRVLANVGGEVVEKGQGVLDRAKEVVADQMAEARIGDRLGESAEELIDTVTGGKSR